MRASEEIAEKSATRPKRTFGRPPKQQDQRQRILLTSARLIATIGYEECTMNHIARELDLTPPAIYHYFPTKQSIFTEVARTAMQGTYDAVSTAVEAAKNEGKNYAEQLHALMTAHARYFDQDYWLVNATIRGYGGNTRREIERLEEFEALRQRNAQVLFDVLRGGVESGEFRSIDENETARSIYQLLNITRWYKPGGKKSAADIAESNFELVIRGISAITDARSATAN